MELYLSLAQVPVLWPALLLLGLAVGVLLGFFGVGGGWLTTPSLNILGLPIVYAIGTGLAYTTGSAIIGALRHYRLGNLDLRLGSILGLSGMAGMELARRAILLLEARGLAELYVRWAYILLLLGVGLSILQERLRTSRPADLEPNSRLGQRLQALRLPPVVPVAHGQTHLSLWTLMAAGLLIGLVAGFLGVGGGFVMVPLLVYVLGVPTRQAVGSSLLSIALTNSYGALSYSQSGKVEWLAASIMFLGATVGAQVGATATGHVQVRSLRMLLGATLLLAGTAVLLQQFGADRSAAILMFGTALSMTLLIIALWLKGFRHPRRSPQHLPLTTDKQQR